MVSVIHDKQDLENKFEEAGNKLVIIDFHATWCGPCKLISPFLEELAKNYPDEVVILKVDVDENEELASTYNISCMPTFIFIKNKQKIGEFAGANQEKLKQLFEQLK